MKATTPYVSRLQAKVYRLDASILQARRDGNKVALELAKRMLDETLFELKQAEFMYS